MNPLVLVNRQHPCPAGLSLELVPVHPDCPHILLEREAADMLALLMAELDGWRSITPVSGWRSPEEQAELYRRSLVERGLAFTRQYVALPGHSEHQTGLAVDLGLFQPEIDLIRPAFPCEGICQAFRDLAPSFGFVERYPAGKEAITGIAHEPWHFRYVGRPHAQRMARLGLTLEEYLT